MNGVEFSQGDGYVQAIITEPGNVAYWNEKNDSFYTFIKVQQTGIPMDKFKERVFEEMEKHKLK